MPATGAGHPRQRQSHTWHPRARQRPARHPRAQQLPNRYPRWQRVAAVVTLSLAGCSGGELPAPPHARDPACVAALTKLPGSLLGQARGTTSTPGTAVYGDPLIVVRCGVPPLGPTTLRCLTIDDVDWVVDDRADPLVFTAFGRSPTIEVRIPTGYPKQDDPGALADLRPVTLELPKTSLRCVG